MAECPFTPPFPAPPKRKPGLLKRFFIGWNSWIHTLYERSYTMKLGATRLPRLTIFMVNELSLVARVMDDAEKIFPKHPLVDELLGPLIGNSVFSANGAEWARQRAMINPAFALTNLARAFPLMAGAVDDLIAQMQGADLSGPVDIDPMMTHVTADIIFRTLFSRPLTGAEAKAVYDAFNLYQQHAQRSTTLGLYGLPRLGFRKKANAAAEGVRAVFAPIIRARFDARARGERGATPDILEALLDARHPESGEPFSFEALVNQIAVIFLAGHETSASSLAWTLYLLAQSPDLQERLCAEIEEATGGGPIGFEQIKRMEGVRNLFREGLRLYPPVSFFPRATTRPITLRDKPVKPGDLLIVSPWLIQRNPNNWQCPHAFDPDRFARPENAKAARNAWLPFGRGPRLCIGAGFAQQEAALVLARIIRAFRLSTPPGFTPELVSRLTLRPKNGIPLILAPR